MKGLAIAVASAVLVAGCAGAQKPARAPNPIVRLPQACGRRAIALTYVGDSLARGWGASSPRNSFASLVYADVLRLHPGSTMRNLGTPGATTDEVAAQEVSKIPQDRGCSLIVIISGGNDVQKLYTPRHFSFSYTKLLASIRARLPHAAIAVIGLPDVSLSPRIPWILKPVESKLSRDANASIAAAARDYGAVFVPLYDLSREQAHRSQSLLSGDGIHPNDAGYRLMADAALPPIMALLLFEVCALTLHRVA